MAQGCAPGDHPAALRSDSFSLSAQVRLASSALGYWAGAATPVHLAEASEELGGRVTRESRLPVTVGLGSRERDYSGLNQLNKLQTWRCFAAAASLPARCWNLAPPA